LIPLRCGYFYAQFLAYQPVQYPGVTSEGAYGTIPELYVTRNWRSRSVGQQLLNEVAKFAKKKGWRRIEVTTPPLPEFDRTLRFYHNNGFEITGGRKLKIDINA
jgi:GNAT superfamily N-acetyltransferase